MKKYFEFRVFRIKESTDVYKAILEKYNMEGEECIFPNNFAALSMGKEMGLMLISSSNKLLVSNSLEESIFSFDARDVYPTETVMGFELSEDFAMQIDKRDLVNLTGLTNLIFPGLEREDNDEIVMRAIADQISIIESMEKAGENKWVL